MSIFDSPIASCVAVREIVLLDETQQECACEHECPPGRVCPLGGYFTVTSGEYESDESVERTNLPAH